MQESKFAACLTALHQSGAEFILVGDLAAVLPILRQTAREMKKREA